MRISDWSSDVCSSDLGADFVIHSTTKYLNGHSDVIGGAVVAADPAQVDALKAWANVIGTTGAPFDAWLTLRGLRTLFPRIERQQSTASVLARHLENHQIGRASCRERVWTSV